MKAILYTLVVLAALCAVPAKAQTIRYVDLQATGANTGTSWANAFVQLQAAIDAAAPGDQIWVAQGRYLPTAIFNGTTFNRSKTFFVSKNISVYGGFAGTETALSQRNPDLNLTILSGDLDNNDLDPDGNHIAEDATQVIGDNAHHVLWIEKVDSTCLIDGFTVTAGLATGSQTNDSQNGGGIYNNASGAGQRSSPKFRNCVFSANRSSFFGAILYNNARQYGTASPQFEHCIFRKNNGIFGGLYNDATFGGTAKPVLDHCIFWENTAQHGGAAIWIQSTFSGANVSPLVRNCVFTKNTSGFGSVLFSNTLDDNVVSAAQFINSTFCENESSFGAVFHLNTSNGSLTEPLFLNCLFVANKATFGAVGNIGNAGTTRVQWTNCSFYGNQSNLGNILRLDNGTDTPILETSFSNCILQANTGGALGTVSLSTASSAVSTRMEYSLIDAGACPPGILCGSGMLYNQNPLFVDPSTRNFRLQISSPAVNSGNNSLLPPGILTDLDDNARLLAGTVDMGPYESGGTPPATLVVHVGTNNNNCQSSEESSATALVQGGVPPYAYLWSTGAATPSINNLSAGTYTVTVFDKNNCPVTATATISNAPPIQIQPTLQNASCSNSNNGQLSLSVSGGTSPYQYLWSTNANTSGLSNLPAGTYTVTVTDAKGCQSTTSATVSAPAPIQIGLVSTPVTCAGAGDGTINTNASGGTSPYQYLWSTNANTPGLGNLPAGTYTVTLTDAKGCQGTTSATVSAPAPIQIGLVSTPVNCAGAGDGTINTNASGGTSPYQYLWSTNASTAGLSNLPAGTYTVTLTDAKGCQSTTSATVVAPAPIQIGLVTTPVTCAGAGDGTINTNASGGTSPYQYLWSTNANTAGLSNLSAGTYIVTITDTKGCQSTTSATVSAPAPIQIGLVTAPVTCAGAGDGTISSSASGGTSPYQYLWSTNASTPGISNLSAGSYTLTITDANNCQSTSSAVIAKSTDLELQLITLIPTACTGTGTIEAAASGGTPPYVYSWSNGASGPIVDNLPAGQYELTLTDAAGCSTSASATVNGGAADTEAPQLIAGNAVVPLGSSGTVQLTLELLGAIATDNCLVSEFLIEPSLFDCAKIGEHLVTITVADPSGNQTQATITVTISDQTPPVLSCPADVQRCPADNPVQYEAPVATDNCLHVGGPGSGWSLLEGLPSGSVFPVGESTLVEYAYTDGSGNVGTCSFTVTISPSVQVQVDAVWPDIGNQSNGAIQVTLLGGMPPFALAWYRDGQLVSTQEDPSGLPSGYYELRITDASGCLFVPEIVFVDQLVRTSEPDWVAGIQLQPNPTHGFTRIVFPGSWDGATVLNIVDATGRLVETRSDLQLPSVDLDCSRLPTGVYTLVFQSASRRGVRQLVVQR
ncbi:MAG: T9SS type A sorting domain-containing protein [Saprospiraceae bacterium]|nr:T9SS type A sorting domain-containing protein [Saprospiraceae bacterium]